MDIWVTAHECVGLPSLPLSRSQILHYAKKNIPLNKIRRRIRSNQIEFNLAFLPLAAQAAYLKKAGNVITYDSNISKKQVEYNAELLWSYVEKATLRQRQNAQQKCQVVIAIEILISSGVKTMQAFAAIAQSHHCNHNSIQRWYYLTRGYNRVDYLPVLLNKRKKTR